LAVSEEFWSNHSVEHAGSLFGSMVSEHIRNSEENKDKDAVETQNPRFNMSVNESGDIKSDNAATDSTTEELDNQRTADEENRPLLGLPASSISSKKIASVPPPPAPGTKPQAKFSNMPLSIDPKKPALPPPPPPGIRSSANPVNSSASESLASTSLEVANFDIDGLLDVIDSKQDQGEGDQDWPSISQTNITAVQSEELAFIDLDLALKKLEEEFEIEDNLNSGVPDNQLEVEKTLVAPNPVARTDSALEEKAEANHADSTEKEISAINREEEEEEEEKNLKPEEDDLTEPALDPHEPAETLSSSVTEEVANGPLDAQSPDLVPNDLFSIEIENYQTGSSSALTETSQAAEISRPSVGATEVEPFKLAGIDLDLADFESSILLPVSAPNDQRPTGLAQSLESAPELVADVEPTTDATQEEALPAVPLHNGRRPERRGLSSLIAKGKIQKQTYNFDKPAVTSSQTDPLNAQDEPPLEPEPMPQQTASLGVDGLPEPWMNMGKKSASASDSSTLPTSVKDTKEDFTSTVQGTTSNPRTFHTNAPRSATSDELHWVSTSTSHNKITEQDLVKLNSGKASPPVADIMETISTVTTSSGGALIDSPVQGTAGSDTLSVTPSPRLLGSLQRTTIESWTPAAQERSSTNWDIVPPSDLHESTAGGPAPFARTQNFSRVLPDEDMVLDDHLVTAQTAEEMFLKGNLTEGCRQYHILIERMENSARPDIKELVHWSEALADLYILLGEPLSAVSFYHKARLLASDSEPRRVQKYLSCLLKLSTWYEEEGRASDAEHTYLEAIKVAGEELDEKDVLHQRINEAYVQHAKRKSENSSTSQTAAIEEQCTTLRMRTVQGPNKSFSATRKPSNVKEIFEETPIEKPAPSEKIKRATGSDIEFKATRGLEELSGHPLVRVLNSIWVQVILGVILMMCGVACIVSLRVGEPIVPRPVAIALKGPYKTADELKVVDFQEHNNVGIWEKGNICTGKFTTVRGNNEDLPDLLRGYLHTNTVFYTLKGDDLLQDDQGRSLYKPSAPEVNMIHHMWWYVGFATWHYKEKHCYQTSTDPWNKVNPDFTYVNPFTGKPTHASITASTGAGNKLLPLIVASGQLYEGEPPPGPGAIRCITFDKVRFFVRGYDRNGKMIQGYEPGKAYTIELTDGENITQKFMNSIGNQSKHDNGLLPLRVVVTENGEIASTYKWWTTLVPAVILTFLFLSLVVAMISVAQKKSKLKWYHYVSTSIAVIVSISWFALALQ